MQNDPSGTTSPARGQRAPIPYHHRQHLCCSNCARVIKSPRGRHCWSEQVKMKQRSSTFLPQWKLGKWDGGEILIICPQLLTKEEVQVPTGRNKQIQDFFQEMPADVLSDKAFPLAKPLILLPCNSLFPRSPDLPETKNSTCKSVIPPLKVHTHTDLKDSQKAHTVGNKLCFNTLVSVNPLVLLYWKSKTNKKNKLHELRTEFPLFCSS